MLRGVDFLDLPIDSPHLSPPSRNYDSTIRRFERHFGVDCVDVRVFERDRLIGGDIKTDFLSAIGIDDASAFEDFGDVNESLSVEVGYAIQLLDPLAETAEDRRHLRSAAISVDRRRLGGAKYFLTRTRVDAIRNRYDEGNRAVARRFFGRDTLFNLRSAWADAPIDQARVASLVGDIVSIWPRYALVWSSMAAGDVLARPAAPMTGWRLVDPNDRSRGVVLEAARGKLPLHYAPRSLFPGHSRATLQMNPPNGLTRRVRIRRGGAEPIEIDCPKEKARFPLDALGCFNTLDIEVEPIDDAGPLEIVGFYFGYD